MATVPHNVLHKDLPQEELHVPKLHAASHKPGGSDPLDITGGSDDSLHLNGDNSSNYSGVVTRDGNGRISVLSRIGGLAFHVTRDVNGYISSIFDGTKTWTIARTNKLITSWTVT